MKIHKDNFFPLFINGNEPIHIYIVADNLIALEMISSYYNTSWYIFNFITKLANNKITKKAFPNQLLQKHKEIFNKVFNVTPCLCGIIDEGNHNRCLSAKLIINEKDEKPIQLREFALLESGRRTPYIYVNKIPGEVYLSSSEAFHLFSNICLVSQGIRLYDDKISGEPYNPELIEQRMEKYYNWNYPKDSSNSGYMNYLIESYCLDYYKYLLKQIKRNDISFETILRLSGAEILTLYLKSDQRAQLFIKARIEELISSPDNLTQNQKICYFTLLILAKKWNSIPEISDLYKENLLLIRKFEKDFIKKFPGATGERRHQNEVFSYYFD